MRVLLAIYYFFYEIFLGCRHDHLTRPFTIKQQSYMVCLDCGRHVFYSMDTMRPLRGRNLRRAKAMLASQIKVMPGVETVQPLSSRGNSRAAA